MNEFLALHLLNFVHPADMIVVCTSDCPDFLPGGLKRIVAKEGKAKIASELMHALLDDPFAPGSDGILTYEAVPSEPAAGRTDGIRGGGRSS